MTAADQGYHLAQINIARARFDLDAPQMSEFEAALEASDGFVWRLKDDSGNAYSIRAFPDPRIVVNLTVWQSMEALQHFVYRSAHVDFLYRRSEWFERAPGAHLALWWVPAGVKPSASDGRFRLEWLTRHGPTERAFSFETRFAPSAAAQNVGDKHEAGAPAHE
jgi:hypothetical protein